MPVSKFFPLVSKIPITIYNVTQFIRSARQIKELNVLRSLNLVVAVVVVVKVIVIVVVGHTLKPG